MTQIKWAVLGVGEGDAEEALLNHLKACYITRECGVSFKVKQTYGKGAAHVLDKARRLRDVADYDRCIVLFDTDTNYSDEVRTTAENEGLLLFPSDPCLEAALLSYYGDIQIRTSARHKLQFEQRFSGRVQDGSVLETHFHRNFLEQVRDRFPDFHRLINSLGVKRSTE